MTHQLVLQLLIEMVKLANEAIKDCPPEIKAKAWERHDRRMEFWEGVWNELKS